MSQPISVAILAGGRSARMGTDKAFVRVLGRPLIETSLAQLSGLGAETLIITNRPDDYAYLNVPLYGDVRPGLGALGGLYTALYHAAQPHVLVAACDMPFAVVPLINYLLSLRAEGDAVVPRLAGEAEPFRAVYSRACLPAIAAALDAGQLQVRGFFKDVRVRWVDEAEIDRRDPRHLSFVNVNTPADLEAARRLAEAEPK
jgi:molybdopterin-guanine dinucleotide biosynthesis protein A